jgi:hypothetical protein
LSQSAGDEAFINLTQGLDKGTVGEANSQGAGGLPCQVQVPDVVVAQFLALELFHRSDGALAVGVYIEGGGLMGVFAVAEALFFCKAHGPELGEVFFEEIAGDGPIVGGCQIKDLAGQAFFER